MTDDLVLARWADPLAVVAGTLVVLTDLDRLLGGRGPVALTTEPFAVVVDAAYAVSFAVPAVALISRPPAPATPPPAPRAR